jgi:hypothetical protein
VQNEQKKQGANECNDMNTKVMCNMYSDRRYGESAGTTRAQARSERRDEWRNKVCIQMHAYERGDNAQGEEMR